MQKVDRSVQMLSDIIVHMKYAKYIPELNRRETWEEICERNMNMHLKKFPQFEQDIRDVYANFILPKKLLPSLRSLQFAGKPIELNPARQYNCSFIIASEVEAFSEAMFLLLSGCGVGYSVQKNHVKKLPPLLGAIKPQGKQRARRFLIADNIEGWADSIKVLMNTYFKGQKQLEFDFRDIRAKGTRLVTSGGKAPGAGPLRDCLAHITSILENAIETRGRGTQLKPIECHDIMCHIADAVLAGGIRRSSCISFFSKDDEEMLYCKSGNWSDLNPQRARANNSAVFIKGVIKKKDFLAFWNVVKNSGCGEPGIFFTNDPDVGSNPCVTGDTEILTDKGYERIDSLLNTKVNIWNGEEWSEVTPKLTGKNQKILTITLADGRSVNCTEYHQFLIQDGDNVVIKKAIDLKVGDVIPKFNLPAGYQTSSVICSVFNFPTLENVYCFNEPKKHQGVFNGILTGQCAEIALIPNEFCNLCEINASSIESQEDFNARAKAAAILGTIQASYTDFHYLRDIWRENCEKEALLGLSMTGVASNVVTKLDSEQAASIAVETNKDWAAKLSINRAKRITTGKPAGTSSCVLGTSSGIHAWHNDFYIRRVRVNKDEAIYAYMMKTNPHLVEDELFSPHTTAVISFPQKAPPGAITRKSENAIDLLNRVKFIYKNWILPGHNEGANTHNQSVTVYIKDHEWDEVGEWMWANRDSYHGISVLPYDGGTYKQAPFEDITEKQYNDMVAKMNPIDLTQVIEYDDNTNLAGEAACAGGACEVIYN